MDIVKHSGFTIPIAIISLLPCGFTPFRLDQPQLQRELERLTSRGLTYYASHNKQSLMVL
jgi:hypothetical protein